MDKNLVLKLAVILKKSFGNDFILKFKYSLPDYIGNRSILHNMAKTFGGKSVYFACRVYDYSLTKNISIPDAYDFLIKNLNFLSYVTFDSVNEEIECNECGGEGTLNCYECGGDGIFQCNDCAGTGELGCTTCSGSGNETCVHCDGESDDCLFCDSNGEIPCRDCDGTGSLGCEECGGDGAVKCRECSGYGYESCNSCRGDGKLETKKPFIPYTVTLSELLENETILSTIRKKIPNRDRIFPVNLTNYTVYSKEYTVEHIHSEHISYYIDPNFINGSYAIKIINIADDDLTCSAVVTWNNLLVFNILFNQSEIDRIISKRFTYK